jgi:putative DNA-invertase from lambdoid prophage Rac
VRRQAAYLRVSTAGQSEALQRDAIQRAAIARGERLDLWFSEVRSGQAWARPELDSVLSLARRGEIGALWVFRLDRLTRRGASDMLTLVKALRDYGCRVISVAEGFELDGPMGDVILAVLGAVAEMELEALRDRTAAARKKAEASGKRWGRPSSASNDQRAQLRQLLEEGGLTLRKAAKQAGLSFSAAQRIVAADTQGKSDGIR